MPTSTSPWRQLNPGRIVREFDWSVNADSALPHWLTSQGTSPVLTYTSPATSRGALTCTTKVSSPTFGDMAGVKTAFSIDSAKFSEIGFFVYGASTNYVNSLDPSFNIGYNDASSQGFYVLNNDQTQLRFYPDSPNAFQFPTWQLSRDPVVGNNSVRRKDFGFVVKPASREFFLTAGDPEEGAGVIYYEPYFLWIDPIQPIILQVIARSAARASITFERVKLRLVSA